ncbi:hypothetical protein F5880DRAFT_215325 [Lentinula raphanica]|nr:hypothetical protein F5880DRAFT_215325 [Lentinula raphanica]
MSSNPNLKASTTSSAPEDKQKDLESGCGDLEQPFPSATITPESTLESDDTLNEDSIESSIQERASEDFQHDTSSNRDHMVESSPFHSPHRSPLHSPLHSPLPLNGSLDKPHFHWKADFERLSAFYPNTAHDFFGTPSTPLCVYKTGDPWFVRTGMESQRIIRETHPVRYDHPIQDNWSNIGKRLYTLLDDKKVRWTSIDPVVFADAGEEPFCPLLLWIGVEPASLSYEDAHTAAEAATFLLTSFGLEGFEIGFRESIVTRSCSSPKMLNYDFSDPVIKFRKPFTSVLGLPIFSLSTHCEGTGALYLRESEDSDRIYLLTCSHLVRLPSNDGPSNRKDYHEKVLTLGPMGYDNAVQRMQDRIDTYTSWLDHFNGLSNNEDESERDRWTPKDISKEIKNLEKNKKTVNELHSEVTKYWTDPDARVIGHTTYAPPVRVAGNGYIEDWALVELKNDKFDWTTFKGNQVFVDKKSSLRDYAQMMYPNREDWENFRYPQDGLLQASGVVPEHEIRHPQHLDRNDNKCLFVLKNGSATGTTFGRTSGMKSYTRTYSGSEIETTAEEIGVHPYHRDQFQGRFPFSDEGDSGSIVLTRDGSVLGMVTGGAGSSGSTDLTYVTPFWFILEQIRNVFPKCHLYQADHDNAVPSC